MIKTRLIQSGKSKTFLFLPHPVNLELTDFKTRKKIIMSAPQKKADEEATNYRNVSSKQTKCFDILISYRIQLQFVLTSFALTRNKVKN